MARLDDSIVEISSLVGLSVLSSSDVVDCSRRTRVDRRVPSHERAAKCGCCRRGINDEHPRYELLPSIQCEKDNCKLFRLNTKLRRPR